VIAAVQQRPEAVRESEALDAALPSSTLVVADYPRMGQLVAHGMIARDLVDLDNALTKQLLAFVRDTPPSP
jgi:hypothetical protein